ncbi:hypothetical protein CW362_00715 [Streptomyces populi]|uniref:Uncharacterized protein n=1 Tax=Streptomyces populi TaxID=2058924 RepID=A0A2I0SYE4_9ACTN|nr:hypothetical protein CW362_00715 [Streptomyces populi]
MTGRTRHGQQRLDERSQFIRHDPRPRLTFAHDRTNDHRSRKAHDQQLLSGPFTVPALTKRIMRQTHGRAGFDLLRHRVLLP